MTAPIEQKVCAVCARVLDRFEPGDGSDPYWRHSLMDGAEEADHPPVPVADNEVRTEYRCDFCNDDESAFILPVRSFEMPGLPGGQYNSAGDWSACRSCGSLIERNQWTGLLRRVKNSHQKRHGLPMDPFIEQGLKQLYQRVRKNQAGALRPFVRPQPASGTPSPKEWGQNRASGPEDL